MVGVYLQFIDRSSDHIYLSPIFQPARNPTTWVGMYTTLPHPMLEDNRKTTRTFIRSSIRHGNLPSLLFNWRFMGNEEVGLISIESAGVFHPPFIADCGGS